MWEPLFDGLGPVVGVRWKHAVGIWHGRVQAVHTVTEEELCSGVEGESRDQLLEVEGDVLLSALPDLAESNV